jgi:hypothetical protein
MFLNISVSAFLSIWLSLFPRKNGGEQNPPLNPPETLGVPTVPPFPRFFFTVTHWVLSNDQHEASL